MAQFEKKFDAADDGEKEDLAVMQKMAILFVALGEEVAGETMKFLGDFEIEQITEAVASLKSVSVEMQDEVLEEFEQSLIAGEWLAQGGIDFARGALERAVGARKAQEILDRVATTVSSGFYMLRNVAPEQVAPFISHEHPQTIALILSQLDSAQASGILAQLPESVQADVAYRIATMENITPAVLKEIEEALEVSLRDILGGNQDVGGPGVVADILNLTGSSVEKNVPGPDGRAGSGGGRDRAQSHVHLCRYSQAHGSGVAAITAASRPEGSHPRPEGGGRGCERQDPRQSIRARARAFHRGDGVPWPDASERGRGGATAYCAAGASVGGAGSGHHRRAERPMNELTDAVECSAISLRTT